MNVHLFGASSSPSIANFALRQITMDQQYDLNVEVQQTILRHFYVDDCLRSVPTEDDAIKHIEELTKACRKGGFHLTKFSCNNTEVLKEIPMKELPNN
jgi:hypothetical protein